MIQIKQSGKVAARELERLRAEFASRSCALLPELIEPSLLRGLLAKVSAASMVQKCELDGQHEFGRVLFIPPNDPALFVFHMLLNNRKLFRAIETITQCQPIGNFVGRIHRSAPGADHHIFWHGDNSDHRLLGLTIDFSDGDYAGGLFQLRKKDSNEIICEVPRHRTGDAFVFQIAPDLQHRLTAIEDGGPRTVGVGWFRSAPEFDIFARNYFKLR